MSTPTDAMTLPLDGIRVVEASAGTGKTFTIATLYLRLILESDIKVDEIVVATFTRAAAAELSTRLRERLVVADEILAGEDPVTPRDGDDGETKAARRVIAQALPAADLDRLRGRVHLARLAIDTAFIGTLHGFCHRVLAEFGFDTGQALAAPELVGDMHELETGIVRDFWRRGSADATTATLLADTWGSPETLARQVCDPRWRGREVEVPAPDMQALESRFRDARRYIAAWDESRLRAAADALPLCVSHPPTLKKRLASLHELHDWAKSPVDDDPSNAAAIEHAAALCAKALDKVNPKGEHASGNAFEDIEALCAAHSAILQAPVRAAELPAARLLRDARTYLDAQRPKRLAERNLMGHDEAVDRLAAALDDPARGATALARIRARWKAALVDEFQDTDARQWQVVRTLFGDSTLVLVGDPKQAIYGFRGGDVYAWLGAVQQATGERLRLAESYRSGEGLCHAVNALFSRPAAFLEAGIGHPDIHSAKPQRALLQNGEPLEALQLWWLDPEAIGHAERSSVPSKARAQTAIQEACVAWIAATLEDAATLLRDEHGNVTRLRAAHVAVLVNDNAQAQAMQAALGRVGIPAASNLRASVYASEEAVDLALLLGALAAPDDARRARAARASLLVGDDAAAIAATLDDEARQAGLLQSVALWADAVRRHGPLPWLHGLLQAASPRLLALPDGERRVANYLQLAELLQALHSESFGADDLATRFARARVEADDDADAARLRLDTDADAVTIATVHAAKGLEYPVVLVPYAVLARDPSRSGGAVPRHWYHDDRNAAHVAIGAATDAAIMERSVLEIRAEEVRKFYVAVTRAAALCVLPYGPTSSTAYSAVFHLLHQAGRDAGDRLGAGTTDCRRALEQLCERAQDAARMVDELPRLPTRTRTTADARPALLGARAFTRTALERDWRIWSFSRLVRGVAPAAVDPLPGTGDADPSTEVDTGPAGARFGTAVHTALEQADFAAWQDATRMPHAERAVIENALRGQGVGDGDAVLARAVELTGDCIRGALNAPLSCGTRLAAVAPGRRRAEIEFHLTLAPARTTELYALLHDHGYQTQRSGVTPHALHGLLTGKIDLVFAHAGRFHIVDWKTNRCAPYDEAAMRAEIALHDYDLQWLLYTLALHRWLERCLPGYDYERHIGEVYYLFVRGMLDGLGVYADRPPRKLVETMDRLFTPPAQAAA